ncbi:MAG TPA: hypothetical protein VMS64_26515 [Candidatus Methylomirabilis sp.]|nr:hypothetical protein [Candidatus Methylomirabilis sp.]
MAFDTVVNLVALSLPVWLVAEQINLWWTSRQNPGTRVEPEPETVVNYRGPLVTSLERPSSIRTAEGRLRKGPVAPIAC